MANLPVTFRKGLLASMPTTKTAGSIYFVTDERAIYLDTSNENRIRIGDFQEVENLAALEAIENPSQSALFYLRQENILAKWDGSKYVQINKDTDTGAVNFILNAGDTGNAVTGWNYNSETRTVTFRKETVFAVPADITTAIENLDLPNTYYSKTLGEKNASDIAAIKDGQSIDSFADVEAKNATQDTAIQAAQTQADKGVADAATAQAAAEAAQAAAEAADAKADTKVASVGATSGKGIEIAGTATAPTVGIKLAATDNDLSFNANGELTYKAAAAAEYTITKQVAAEEGYLATYQLFKDGSAVGDKINVPRDFLVKSAIVEVVSEADVPYSGAVVGDKYIDFVVNVKAGSATDEHIYLPVQDLVDVYNAGNGLELGANNTFAIKIDATNANGLAVDASGLKIGLATDSAAGAMSAADHAKLHEHTNKAELDLIQTGDKAKWDAAEQNAKDYADSLAPNYDPAGSAATAKSEVIGVSGDAKTANTIYGAKAFASDAATTAEANAKSYADSLAPNYDAAGDADAVKTELLGNASTDTSSSKTIEGTRKYIDEQIQSGLSWVDF